MRKEFVLKALAGEASIAELCRQYGISRKTGHKWIKRFRAKGVEGLLDESRAPDSSPLKTTAEAALEVIRLRQAHPTWGPRKLQRILERLMDAETAPSERTVARILTASQLVKPRRKNRLGYFPAARAPRVVVEQSNDLWTVDFKGWWCTGDGRRCEPLTVRDAFSRIVLALRVLEGTSEKYVRPVFEELFDRYGLPKAIQSDNGPPFVSVRAIAGLTRLAAWWVSAGIELVRSRPGCPQDNGAHERMHADIRLELEADAAESLALQQEACDKWRIEFNHVRPHEALDMRTPAEVYKPSARRRGHVIIGGYPDGCELHRVDARGAVQKYGRAVFVTHALTGHHVGFQQVGAEVRVWFYHMLIGTFVWPERGKEVSVQPIPVEETQPQRPVPECTDGVTPSTPGGNTSQPAAPSYDDRSSSGDHAEHRDTGLLLDEGGYRGGDSRGNREGDTV
jgi:transposase InsO family protein